jgi:hypothetical protein
MPRQLGADFPWLHTRKNREGFDAGIVVGKPVDHGVALAAEFFGGHMERL